MKFIITFVSIFLLTSCYSNKQILSRNDPEKDNVSKMLAKVVPGNRYVLTLADGSQMKVMPMSVGSDQLRAEVINQDVRFTRVFRVEEIRNIKSRKLSALKTAAVVMIPVTAALYGIALSFPQGTIDLKN